MSVVIYAFSFVPISFAETLFAGISVNVASASVASIIGANNASITATDGSYTYVFF